MLQKREIKEKKGVKKKEKVFSTRETEKESCDLISLNFGRWMYGNIVVPKIWV